MKRRAISKKILTGLISFILLGLVSCSSPITLYKGYVVQLITSSCEARAEVIKEDFKMDGYTAFVSPLMFNNQLLYRVQIGPYAKQVEAEKLLTELQQRYPLNPYVKIAIIKKL